MKELSIEEKAKAYDEAIKKAEVLYKTAEPMSGCNVLLETVFPKLKENEDERIRKSIIAIINNFVDNSNTFKPKMIAWLEKQGEHEGLDYPYVAGWRKNYKDNKPKVKHSVLMFTTHGIAEGEWLGGEWCQYRWSCKIKDEDVLYWLHLSDLENLEKENGEQKPVDKAEPKFKQGDIIKEKETGNLFYVNSVENFGYTLHYKDCIEKGCVMSFKYEDNYELVEHTPTWSEEDKDYYDAIITKLEITQDDASLTDNQMEFLKSLKNRVQLLPKQEWSEEDERMYSGLHNLIYSTPYCDSRKEFSDWFKSLKERIQLP